jgi:Tfp pilus assembly protein PilN
MTRDWSLFMRELDFVPDWYRQTRRRRRLVVLHVWMSAALAGGLGLWMVLVLGNIRTAESTLSNLQSQVNQTDRQFTEMKSLSADLNRWRQQDRILSKLGYQIEVARLLRTLDTVMPRELSLLGVQCDTEERPQPTASGAVTTVADQVNDRRMRIRLQGAAPTDVDLTNFVTQLGTVAFFDNVLVVYVRDANSNGHAMREFEVTFSVNLNMPAGS